MLMILAAFVGHPHPLIRALVVLMFFGAILALVGVAIYARHRRHAELTSRLKVMEEKLDRMAGSQTRTNI